MVNGEKWELPLNKPSHPNVKADVKSSSHKSHSESAFFCIDAESML